MNEKLFCPTRPRCGAHARTTGKPCKKVAMVNGRCRSHGGRSLKGKDSPTYKHGFRTKEVQQLLQENRKRMRLIRQLLKE